MTIKTVLLIDPIHSAGYLSNKLKSLGIRSIAIFSDMSNISEFNRPKKDLFDLQIHIKDETIEQIIYKLANESIDFVINGSDQHVAFSEKIAEKITPNYSNDASTSSFRQSKFLQQEIMKKCGLNYIKQTTIDVVSDNFNTNDLKDLNYPVFAKPENGGGSIGIFKALNYDDLIEKLGKAPKMVNFDRIDKYIVQEFINGDEIIIDTFSIGGVHKISNVVTYTKKLVYGAPVYRTVELIYDDEIRNKAIELTKKILNCCGVLNGFSHVELFHLGNGEFKLIELNPRISGGSGCMNIMASTVGLKSQDLILKESLFDENSTESNFKLRHGFTKSLFLYGHYDFNLEEFDSYSQHFELSKNEYIDRRPPDLTDLRKIVILFNESKEKLEEDSHNILMKDIF